MRGAAASPSGGAVKLPTTDRNKGGLDFIYTRSHNFFFLSSHYCFPGPFISSTPGRRKVDELARLVYPNLETRTPDRSSRPPPTEQRGNAAFLADDGNRWEQTHFREGQTRQGDAVNRSGEQYTIFVNGTGKMNSVYPIVSYISRTQPNT